MKKKTIIYKVKRRDMPKAFVDSEVFSDLLPITRKHFAGRLFYIETMSMKMSDFELNKLDPTTVLVDRIELDLYVNLSAPDHTDTGRISAWMIHSNWRFPASRRPLIDFLDKSFEDRLKEFENCDILEFDIYNYFKRGGEIVMEALEKFYSSTDFGSGLLYLMILDMLMGKILYSCIKFRIYNYVD